MRTDLFAENSRYFHIATRELTLPNGTTVRYLLRRFCPDPDTLAVIAEHRRDEHERLDHIAAAYFGDPERFWALCDANNALDPAELTRIAGAVLRITLPEGIPGNSPAL